MDTSAIILLRKKKVQFKKIRIPELKRGQLLVRIKYTSICHTQVQEIDGLRGKDNFLPHCLGHEATGVIINKNDSVKKFKINDKVCLSWVPSEGFNAGGTIYFDKRGKKINAGPVNTFSDYCVISENKIQKLNKNSNMKKSVLLGCALPTAYNCIFSNVSQAKKKKILIIGCGGVGLSIVHASKIAKFSKISIIEKDSMKIKTALKLGASHVLKNKDFNNYLDCFDYVVECTGNKEMLNFSIKFVKKFGGSLIIVGNYKYKAKFKIDPWQILYGKNVIGSWNKPFNYKKKFKQYEKFSKKLKSNLIFGKNIYSLKNFSSAMNDFKKGKVIRPLIKVS
tara:strand:- start:1528 stop:2538 length:1011 start_codon:yes stop_codon:yes gene_type:complete